jgi:hypothetical protein
MFMDLYCENKVFVQVVDFSMVSSVFHVISRFFDPFLSWKGLVSRGLRINQGLFEFKCRGEKLVFRDFDVGRETRIAQIIAKAGGGCIHEERRGGVESGRSAFAGLRRDKVKHNKTR